MRDRYRDFGPTLASEKLLEWHQIAVSTETLRKWMTEAGFWTSRRERKKQLHQPRGRRDCLGELVQIDGSHHWWFESRGNGMLIVNERQIDQTWPLLAPFDPPPLRIDKFDHWNLGTYNSAILAGIAQRSAFIEKLG
ncbi:hypothetical protein ACVWWD_005954 [Mesorhizobium sp. URHB0026]